MKKTVKVVAGVIENEKSEILCALRSHTMSIPNTWEFPGGKVEQDENEQEALEREIYEELNCTIKAGATIHNDTHEYEKFIINLIIMDATLIKGTPVAKEHAKVIWLPIDHLNAIKWAPADIPAVEKIMKQNE
ncbi:NUDIX hydrolase [Gracilibacillus halophilus YIM-C55.5]|uniref:8-oxo-dGTP diphosphatase n=1 Tax=Gracilibacillus halophilus YIM-C55.5 TaxID=1308866 RepID=N4WTC0_9BACI|nr:(deoxy)nucleoside triphosphate pyrophosphohydrolase [Gracilibacillus halophilus]ENH97565.1 NUDIX hydrolase [Gracilibacillus halophilus YIM-C55.5]